ncbi:hypothetical protein [Arsenophonus nasoniae]|nr:hypothetical protein [Arsenophonus nasoniae]
MYKFIFHPLRATFAITLSTKPPSRTKPLTRNQQLILNNFPQRC